MHLDRVIENFHIEMICHGDLKGVRLGMNVCMNN
jgi:hypothetical protein